MIEPVLSMVPDYGLPLVFAVVLLACMAAPLPASMIVLAAGSFAAAGDLDIWRVLLATFAGFVIGDQLAFGLAHRMGPVLLSRLEKSRRTAPVLNRSKDLLQAHGRSAIFLSHTVLSPTCAYVTYISAAGGLGWRAYTLPAIAGAMIWSLVYVGLGFAFAANLEQVAVILNDFFYIILAGLIALGCLLPLRRRWKRTSEALVEP